MIGPTDLDVIFMRLAHLDIWCCLFSMWTVNLISIFGGEVFAPLDALERFKE